MKVTAKLFGTLRRFSDSDSPGRWSGDLEQGSTINDLLMFWGTSYKEVAVAQLNGAVADLDTLLSDGDLLVLVTPIGGG